MICAYDEQELCWVAAGKGVLRPIITEGTTRKEAMDAYLHTFEHQQGEEYAMEQSMTALADVSYGEGAYGEDLG